LLLTSPPGVCCIGSCGSDGRRVSMHFTTGKGERRGKSWAARGFGGRHGKWGDGVTAGPTELTAGAQTPGHVGSAASRAERVLWSIGRPRHFAAGLFHWFKPRILN
jgi:hypothetical protein